MHDKQILWKSLIALLFLAIAVQPCPAQSWPGAGPGGEQRSAVPAAPERPAPASRPSTWPGSGETSPWPPPEQQPRQPQPATPPANQLQPCPGTRIIARVGSEAILESDVLAVVNDLIEKNKDRIPPDQIEAQREILIKQRLKSYIEAKLIAQDAKRTIPPEGWQHVQEQLNKEFEERHLEKLIKEAGVGSRHELDLKYRSLGSSLEQEKRAFAERTLAQEWMRQQIKRDEEVTCDQVIGYYYQHIDEFTHPARARWEELMVRFSDHPTRAAARDALARLGNQVLAGAPLADVARRGSGGTTADEGGQHPWTSKGSLVCQEIDRALFGLPVGQLSPIIEGPTGWHIVRVVEREEEHVTPYRDAQVEIREKIIRERRDKQYREFMAKLEAQTPVWTIFDEADGRTLISGRSEQRK